MSAFVVDKAHIDALVQAGLAPHKIQGYKLSWYWEGERHELTTRTADRVGQMLLDENVRSCGHRYPGGEDLPGRYITATIAEGVEISAPEYLEPYKFTPRIHRHYKPVEVLKAISCYEYQACETDDWEASEAFKFCQALQARSINMLPGYDEATWEIS